MSQTESNLDVILAAAEKTLAEVDAPPVPTDPTAQADLIHDVIVNLGVKSPDIFGMLSNLFATTPAVVMPEPPSSPPPITCDTAIGEVSFTAPPPLGDKLPALGTPNLEELFGAKVSDPVDKFFINLMASIGSVLSTFFQLATIQSRELLDQFNATRQTQLLSPADLADMVERNILAEPDAAKEAAGSGVNAERFHNLVLDTGEPPGIVQMLSLLRRGLITEEHFFQAVAYSRVRTEYFCDLVNLANETMSGADAIESYIKGVPVTVDDFAAENLTVDTSPHAAPLNDQFFAAMFRRAGGLPSQWNLLKDSAGDAIGVQRAASLEAHGLISKAQFEDIIKRSRINPIFTYAALLGNKKWFSSFQIGAIVTADPALAPQATQWLIQDGYPVDQAKALVAAKAGGKVAKPKSETEAQLMAAYEAGIVHKPDFETGMTHLGYPAAAITAIEQSIEARRVLAADLAAIAKVRASYLARHIAWPKAHAELMQLQIDPVVILHYQTIWSTELASQVKGITPSQLGSLVRKGREGKAAAIAIWQTMGYSPLEADLMYKEYAPTPASLKSGMIAPNAPA
jgi:hypothetical protein